MEENETQENTYDDGFALGWHLSEEMQTKLVSKTLTEEDVLTIGNMFMTFYDKLEAKTATPYEEGYVNGVSAYAKSLDEPVTESATIS